MTIAEELIEAASSGEGAAEKVAAMLKTFSEAERKGVDEKNQELLGKFKRYQPWEAMATELGISPDDVRKQLDEKRQLAEKLEHQGKEAEAKKQGVDNEAVERLAQERASKTIAMKVEEWEQREKRLADQLEALKTDRDLLHDRYLSHAKKFEAFRVAGGRVDPLTADFFNTLVSSILDPLPVMNGAGEERPWYLRDDPDFRLVDDGGKAMSGKEGPMLLPEWFEDRSSDPKFSARFLVQKGSGGGASSVTNASPARYDPKAPARHDFDEAFNI